MHHGPYCAYGFGHFMSNSPMFARILFITVFWRFWIEPLFRLYAEKETKSDVLKLTVLICVRMADADDFSSIFIIFIVNECKNIYSFFKVIVCKSVYSINNFTYKHC